MVGQTDAGADAYPDRLTIESSMAEEHVRSERLMMRVYRVLLMAAAMAMVHHMCTHGRLLLKTG